MDKVNFDKRIGDFSKVNILDDLLCKVVQEGNYNAACRLINQGVCIEVTENGRKEPTIKEDEEELVIKKNGEGVEGYKITINNFTANPRCYDSMPLSLAIESDHYEMARMLLEAGADIRKVSNSFVYAAKEGYAQMVEFLIKRNVDLSYNYYQALKYAVSANQVEVIKVIVEASKEMTMEHYNAFEYAVANGKIELVKLMISKGINVNGFSIRPLRLAIKCNQKEIVELLLTAGADFSKDDVETAKECLLEDIAKVIEDALEKKE